MLSNYAIHLIVWNSNAMVGWLVDKVAALRILTALDPMKVLARV